MCGYRHIHDYRHAWEGSFVCQCKCALWICTYSPFCRHRYLPLSQRRKLHGWFLPAWHLSMPMPRWLHWFHLWTGYLWVWCDRACGVVWCPCSVIVLWCGVVWCGVMGCDVIHVGPSDMCDVIWCHTCCHEVQCDALMWHVVTCNVMSYDAIHVVSWSAMWCYICCDMLWHVMWCHMMPYVYVVACGVMWCGVMCDVVWCCVMQCGVMWCHVASCNAMLCRVVSCGIVWCNGVWCHELSVCCVLHLRWPSLCVWAVCSQTVCLFSFGRRGRMWHRCSGNLLNIQHA